MSIIYGSRPEGKVVRECRWERMPELSLLTRSSAETGRKGENGGSIALSKHAPKSPIGREVDKGNPGIQDGSHRLELTNRWERRGVEGEQSGGSLSLIGRSRREKNHCDYLFSHNKFSFQSNLVWS